MKEYFQLKIGGNIKIFSLGRKNNIVIKKRVTQSGIRANSSLVFNEFLSVVLICKSCSQSAENGKDVFVGSYGARGSEKFCSCSS